MVTPLGRVADLTAIAFLTGPLHPRLVTPILVAAEMQVRRFQVVNLVANAAASAVG